MIYSRQKGELMVSENRSSEAESRAFIGKWCISIHTASNTSRVHRALQESPGTWEGRECSVLAVNGMGSHLQCSQPMGP